MKKKRTWIKWVILLMIVAGAASLYVTMGKTSDAVAYREVIAQAGDLTTYYNFDGVVRAGRSQTITASAGDRVKAVYVAQNEQVREGDRLYKTDGGATVKADMDGEVTGLYVSAGDVIAAGDKTVQIIDMDNLEVELSVDEYDVGAMTQGTPVEVTILANGYQVSGVVTGLDKNGTASGDLSYYTATVALDAAEGVYPGMQASAKALRSHAENAVLLKMEAISFDEYNKPYVLMREADGKEPVRVPVTIGASDGINCEIVSGLASGDVVLKSSGLTTAELMAMMRSANPMLN